MFLDFRENIVGFFYQINNSLVQLFKVATCFFVAIRYCLMHAINLLSFCIGSKSRICKKTLSNMSLWSTGLFSQTNFKIPLSFGKKNKHQEGSDQEVVKARQCLICETLFSVPMFWKDDADQWVAVNALASYYIWLPFWRS